ncbi:MULTISPECIES: ABC transporter substrate-binding protein [unclassified Bifidobacterium]|uniref:ABC transporter substrate-binding protein n=1 Tax=unclassified Bifidobacterium TaxID=2608897 RepID=UPI0023F96A72|nr:MULTISPECIES: ABC transporter substrate-binding protein [unclassified Bifidobacterium]WEV65708.1 ABC transporter substrate-binding protein [Bifidobacterium sp. ESL0764]WEV75505.1 ABC transporter substrate-binding protein [Bifidobacterium sp. ESL0800]
MKRINSLIAAGVAVTICASLAGCGSSGSKGASSDGVYYLNNKSEIVDSIQVLGKKFTKETGVPFNARSATSGTYVQTLKSELAKSKPPTVFRVLGQVGLDQYKDYAAPIEDTEAYKQLEDKSVALRSDDGKHVLAVPMVNETYGLIYRKDLLQKYFDMPGASIKNVKDIKDFKSLKTVADEIQANKDKLGLEGAFSSMGFDASSYFRWYVHLSNMPIAYEFEKDHITKQPATIKGTFLPQFKNITDLYMNDSTVPKNTLGSKTLNDSLAEFNTGKAVFFHNGSWAWPNIRDGKVSASNVGAIPIYIGAPGESNYGMATGSETYWMVNKKASPKAIKATKDFLKWLVTSDTGRDEWANTMGFSTPFKTFTGKYATKNPIMQAANEYKKEGKKDVPWDFLYIPSEQWKSDLTNALLGYAQGTNGWDKVSKVFVDEWASEYKIAHQSK